MTIDKNIKGRKQELKSYYDKVWSLVTSGEIQLELDLHFTYNNKKYVVDFKIGFGSNGKGKTNRLLLVATIYQNLNDYNKCLLFVRAKENSNYFNRLKNSGIWCAYCGMRLIRKSKNYKKKLFISFVIEEEKYKDFLVERSNSQRLTQHDNKINCEKYDSRLQGFCKKADLEFRIKLLEHLSIRVSHQS